MKAEEIRELVNKRYGGSQDLDESEITILLLSEIAGQLADLNHHLKAVDMAVFGK